MRGPLYDLSASERFLMLAPNLICFRLPFESEFLQAAVERERASVLPVFYIEVADRDPDKNNKIITSPDDNSKITTSPDKHNKSGHDLRLGGDIAACRFS